MSLEDLQQSVIEAIRQEGTKEVLFTLAASFAELHREPEHSCCPELLEIEDGLLKLTRL